MLANVDLAAYQKALTISSLFSEKWLLPLNITCDTIDVATEKVNDTRLITLLTHQTGRRILCHLADKQALQKQLTHLRLMHYQEKLADNIDNHVVPFVDHLITESILHNASDIHVEINKQQTIIRERVDGLLTPLTTLPKHFHKHIVNRLKILCDADITQTRLPQDGRCHFETNTGEQRDCRLSFCPTHFGEKVVIRLLNPMASCLSASEMGLLPEQQAVIKKHLTQCGGMILISGPTGSGKSSTLYHLLTQLDAKHLNISTIENPVEMLIKQVNQINTTRELGFSTLLRTLLRQDPDVIMIGEIRDTETANIALKAAQTGHLVLASIHANSATSSIIRLQQMGIPSHHIAAALKLVIAQRLVRKQVNSEYHGRIGLFETLPIDASLAQLIASTPSLDEIDAFCNQLQLLRLAAVAKQAVDNGLTTIAECQRVLDVDFS